MAFSKGPYNPLRRRSSEEAEALAIAALGFLAADGDRLGRFLAVTGLGPDTLRSAAGEPGFLASVLSYLATDEALLVAFAAEADVSPETVARAERALAGSGPGPGDFNA